MDKGGFVYDAHVHMALDGRNWKAALARHASGVDEAAIHETLQRYARAGTAYVRDGGDKYLAGLEAARIAPEYGIRYVSPAFPLYQAGSYGGFIGRSFEDERQAKALIDEALASGATFIKIMTTGILDFNAFGVITAQTLAPKLLEAIVAYAHARGVAVMAHTNGAQAIKQALQAGVDSIEHGYYADREAIDLMAQTHAIWVPTLAPICNALAHAEHPVTLEAIRDAQLDAIAYAAQHGVLVACGSDAGAGYVEHASGARDEYALLETALGDATDSVLEQAYAELVKRF